MKIEIFAAGGPIKKCYAAAIKEYAKRLSGFCAIRVTTVRDDRAIEKKSSDKSLCIVISVKGENITSEELAARLDGYMQSGRTDISIMIGDEDAKGDEILSISPMDMETGLKTAIVCEQVYRAYRILTNQPYHK